MELNLHSPYIFTACLTKHMDNFTFLPEYYLHQYLPEVKFILLLEIKHNLLCIQDLQQKWSHTEGLGSLKKT